MQDGYFNFDIYADIYDQTRKFPKQLVLLIDLIVNELPPRSRSRVLEIGCGTSLLYEPLSSQIAGEYIGIDISNRMLRIARGRCDPIFARLCQADSYFLPFQAARFDLILLVRTIHLFSKWKLAVNEIKRVIKSTGQLIVVTGGFGKNFLGSSPTLNEYKRLREEVYGVPIYIYGADYPDFEAYVRSVGGMVKTNKIRNTKRVNLREWFGEYSNQYHTWTKQLPKDQHDELMLQIKEYIEQTHGSLDVEEKFKLHVTIGQIEFEK